jgi:CubicO group peptidase (beta-lactamase class C family)
MQNSKSRDSLALPEPGVIQLTVDAAGITSRAIRGMADIENGRPMQEDTILWMASTGKTVTAMAFMMLVDEGKAALDDPASRYLPHFRHLYRKVVAPDGTETCVREKRTVTIRHLLSHTAGLEFLPGFFQKQELAYISLETQSHVYAASPLMFEPGTNWSYSNAGINATGRIIEVITGESYEDFVRTRLFEKLGMHDTGYRLNAEQLARRAVGYGYDPEKKSWIRYGIIDQMRYLPYDDPARHAECGGGLFSTAADMARLAQMIANHGVFNGRRIISLESLREICRRQTPGTIEHAYGLGSDVGLVGHGGAWGTKMQVNLDQQQGALLLLQRIGDWPENPRMVCGW